MASHEILGGWFRSIGAAGRYWQCSASIDGRQYRSHDEGRRPDPAKQFAEDWYLGLRGKARAGLLKNRKDVRRRPPTNSRKNTRIITEGQRSQRWTEGHKIRIRLHLRPFFGELGLPR